MFWRWEILTRENPWDELGTDIAFMTLCGKLQSALQTGRRPTISDSLASKHALYVDLIKRCWTGDPAARPVFSEVVYALEHCTSPTPPETGGDASHIHMELSTLGRMHNRLDNQSPLTERLLEEQICD